jgi:hypothetical protein
MVVRNHERHVRESLAALLRKQSPQLPSASGYRPKPPVALLSVNVCNVLDSGHSQAAGPKIRIFIPNVSFAKR